MSHALVASLALSILVGQVAPNQQRDARPADTPSGTAVIRGRVYRADSGVPVRRAIVTLMPFVSAPPAPPPPSAAQVAPPPRTQNTNVPSGAPRNTVTDASGRFAFTGLPAGRYRVRAQPPMQTGLYLAATYGGGDWMEPGRTIDLENGEQFDQADIPLRRGGAIAGRVVDEDAEPLSRVNVVSYRVMPGSGTLQQTGAGFIASDDHGRYRIYGLEPGDYVVSAESRGMWRPPVEGVESEGFMKTYHPSTPNDREATRVRVRTGADTDGVDIQVIRTRTFQITGTVVDSKGQSVARSMIQLMKQVAPGTDSGAGSQGMDPQGRFTIRDIPPGDYMLSVTTGTFEPPQPGVPPPVREYAAVPVSVTADIENLVVVTQRGVSVAGQVVFADGQPPPDAGPLRVMTQPAFRRPMFGPPPSVTAGADHRFTLADLFGPQLIRVGLRREWALKAIMLGSTDITDTPVEFKPEHSGHLAIVVSTRAATVEGTVTRDDGAPVEQAMVIVFPEDKDSWRVGSPRMRTAVSAKNGRYTTGGLVGGRYLAVALPFRSFVLTPDTTPDVFETLARDATRLVVSDGEQRVVDLRLSKGPE